MKCPECGAKLDSTETFWDCPECGYFKVKSKYARLEAANERFLKNSSATMICQKDALPAVILLTRIARAVVPYSTTKHFPLGSGHFQPTAHFLGLLLKAYQDTFAGQPQAPPAHQTAFHRASPSSCEAWRCSGFVFLPQPLLSSAQLPCTS